jgi:large subunit ribosomal protein L15
MIKLHTLKVFKGSTKRRKVVGRGLGSGHGTYSTRGSKGQTQRKSGTLRPGFEGGRQPLIRQMPKLRGFRSYHAKPQSVNIGRLNVFEDGAVVTVESLLAKKVIRVNGPAKVLTGGTLKKKLTIEIPTSKGAKEQIEKLGGTVK